MTKDCTTHHHACACRESHFRRLQQDNSWAEEKLSGMAIELAELREAVDEVLNASVSSLEYRSNRLQLAMWGLRAVRDKALLKQEGE